MASSSYRDAAGYLYARVGYRPEVAIVCGSGLSHLSESLADPVVVQYEDIPGFSKATVVGHHGELVFGKLGGIDCVCMRGRFHYYEGNSMQQVVFPIRVLRFLGCKLMLATNAAGGLNPKFNVGDLVCIQDHFGGPAMVGNNPLVGPNDGELGPRFPPISDCYSKDLQDMIVAAAKNIGISSKLRTDGVYCFTSGPSYESMAECKLLRRVGGDCVGMSTIPEVIAARHCGMSAVVLSMITNKVVAEYSKDTVHASHEEVIDAAAQGGADMMSLVKSLIQQAVIGDFLSKQKAPPAVPPAPGMFSSFSFSNLASALIPSLSEAVKIAAVSAIVCVALARK